MAHVTCDIVYTYYAFCSKGDTPQILLVHTKIVKIPSPHITVSLIALGTGVVCYKRSSRFRSNNHLRSSTEALMTAQDNSPDDEITPVSVYKMDDVKWENDIPQYSGVVPADHDNELLDHSILPTSDDIET